MSNIMIFRNSCLVLATLAVILSALPVSGLGIEESVKDTCQQMKADILAKAGNESVMQVKFWHSDEIDDFSQHDRVTITAPQPVGDFTYRVNQRMVTFVDMSTGNPSEWAWTFGDGSGSTQQSPVHFYSDPGTYSVTLHVSNLAGSSSKTRTLNLNQPPAADFQYSVEGTTVTFTDTSPGGPSDWYWTFGDGMSSRARDPVHTYTSAGFYTVTVTVENNAGSSSKTRTLNLNQPPAADFHYSIEGTTVTFTDTSSGGPNEWHWVFGDGSETTERNPVHTFGAGGTYTVTLAVSGGQTHSSVSKPVNLAGLPCADFGYTIQNLIVSFRDTSTGGVTGWLWKFGDGRESAARNPYHIYALPGRYPVVLTVTNSAGSTTVTRDVMVTGIIPELQPDIVVGDILNIPDRLTPGEKLMIPVEIRNQGTAPAGSFFTYYYLSPDVNYSADDIWLGSQFIASLRENGTITQLAILSIPPRISGGEYYVIAVGDATDVIQESDENNIRVTTDPSLLTGKVAVTKTSMDTLFPGSYSKTDYMRSILTR